MVTYHVYCFFFETVLYRNSTVENFQGKFQKNSSVSLISEELRTLIEGNDYETRQSSLLYVFVRFFDLDPAHNTIVVYSVLRN